MKKSIYIFYISLLLVTNCFGFFDFSLHLNFELQIVDTNKIQDTTSLQDTTIKIDTTQQVRADTLFPIQFSTIQSKAQYSTILHREEIKWYDYRYLGDIFSYLPTGFLQDLGSFGQPSEIILYGLGHNNISYIADGTPINNRIQNSFDANNFSLEIIDSLEVVPLPRGFLYGSQNNPISVNFITKDEISLRPFSRIRFHQAPYEEGMIDAMLNMYPFKKVNFTFQLSNSSIEPVARYARNNLYGYSSADAGIWMLNTKIKYFLSNKINFLAGYHWVSSKVFLNGGAMSTDGLDELPYQVFYDSRYQLQNQHNFNLKVLTKFIKSFPSTLNLYYHYNEIKFRQNEYEEAIATPIIFDDNKYHLLGTNLYQNLNLKYFNGEIILGYEYAKYKTDLLNNNESISTSFLSGKINFPLMKDLLIPSVYGKILYQQEKTYQGLGADVNLNISKKVNLYVGFSFFDRPLNIIEKYFSNATIEKQKYKVFEMGTKVNLGKLKASASFFTSKIENNSLPVINIYSDTLLVTNVGFYTFVESVRSGVSINISYSIWKLLFSFNSTYNYANDAEKLYRVPDITAVGGVYYVDTLFEKNLKLKAGLNFKYFGNRDYQIYDFEKNISALHYFHQSLGNLNFLSATLFKPKFQIDIFIAGQIKSNAVLYFVFENLLNQTNYIIPYYPKQERGIRFGFSWQFLD
ncbi:MAG: TonB-dependent receptor plug domain-containing protein [Ignavibacteriales bacterium]|nr:TonB-dependent receptor plug domain-containing protein [Ignavibacteriales bacterium]